MSTSGLILALVVLVVGAAWLMLPLWQERRATNLAAADRQKAREILITHYERILASMRDLDEDFLVGKIPEAAYRQERAAWAAEGTAILQAIEKGKTNS
ncbi:MAG: hypothetical protein L6Q98_00605 [Anaerolineae bacterium]|nr:hypothetical protein [Anaerolineae bacterium]NUQ04925.1 hypothetical protein [Anaerolineae bacterium]